MIYLYQGDTPVSFTSHLTPSLKYQHTPIPLVVISSSHPNCEYTWDCPQDKNMEFPSLPVMFVDQPLLFQCTICVDGDEVSSTIFDVKMSVITG